MDVRHYHGYNIFYRLIPYICTCGLNIYISFTHIFIIFVYIDFSPNYEFIAAIYWPIKLPLMSRFWWVNLTGSGTTPMTFPKDSIKPTYSSLFNFLLEPHPENICKCMHLLYFGMCFPTENPIAQQ